MNAKRSLLLLIFTCLTTAVLRPMDNDFDADLEDFTMVEVAKEPTKKASVTIDDAKKMITKAEQKLNQAKDFIESDELKGMVSTLQNMKNALRKMVFKEGPGFQITNKTKTPIWATVISNGRIKSNQKIFGCDKIAPGEKFTLELKNLKENMLVGIYLNNPKVVNYSIENDALVPTPDYLYETTEGAQGKTKYLTWNPEKHKMASKYLYPQTGILAGLAKGTRSKYSLSNNIKSFQIVIRETEEMEVPEE